MVNINISVGELFDKISILQIKKIKINNQVKYSNVCNELSHLLNISKNIKVDNTILKNLYDVNLKLWDIEDRIRLKEKNKEFDKEFIDLARSVYITNDKRADIKKQINILTNSELVEEKSYEEY